MVLMEGFQYVDDEDFYECLFGGQNEVMQPQKYEVPEDSSPACSWHIFPCHLHVDKNLMGVWMPHMASWAVILRKSNSSISESHYSLFYHFHKIMSHCVTTRTFKPPRNSEKTRICFVEQPLKQNKFNYRVLLCRRGGPCCKKIHASLKHGCDS